MVGRVARGLKRGQGPFMHPDVIGVGIGAMFGVGDDDVRAEMADAGDKLGHSRIHRRLLHPAIGPIQPFQAVDAQGAAATGQFLRAYRGQRLWRGAVIAIDGGRFAARGADQGHVGAGGGVMGQGPPTLISSSGWAKRARMRKDKVMRGLYTRWPRAESAYPRRVAACVVVTALTQRVITC